MRTYKMYTADVDGNNLANITIQRSGRVRSIRWACMIADATNGHTFTVELSTSATAQLSTHDTIGPIDEVRWYNNVGAAGTDNGSINVQRLIDFPMAAGERLYLNGVSTVTSASAAVYVDVDEGR